MAGDKDKYIGIVADLIRLTSEGKLRWQPFDSRPTVGTPYESGAWTAAYKGRVFRLQANQRSALEIGSFLAGLAIGGNYILEVVGADGEAIVFPPLKAIDNLAAMVKRGRQGRYSRHYEDAELDELRDLLSSD